MQQRSFFDTIVRFAKGLFWIFLLATILPSFIALFKENIEDGSRSHFGYLVLKGELIDSAVYTKYIRLFEATPSIKGILIKCDCPGGAAPASQALFSQLSQCKKPVVFFVENVCASGAYYASLAAKKVIANPSSLVGSIGVIMTLPELRGLLDRFDIHVNLVHAGTYKAVGSVSEPLSQEHKQLLQSIVDDSYQQFIEDVARCRGLDVKNHKVWADGKVFTGRQALELGLIDQLGSVSEAVRELKELTGVTGETKFITPKRQSPLASFFLGGDDDVDGGQEISFSVASFLRSVMQHFCTLSEKTVLT